MRRDKQAESVTFLIRLPAEVESWFRAQARAECSTRQAVIASILCNFHRAQAVDVPKVPKGRSGQGKRSRKTA